MDASNIVHKKRQFKFKSRHLSELWTDGYYDTDSWSIKFHRIELKVVSAYFFNRAFPYKERWPGGGLIFSHSSAEHKEYERDTWLAIDFENDEVLLFDFTGRIEIPTTWKLIEFQYQAGRFFIDKWSQPYLLCPDGTRDMRLNFKTEEVLFLDPVLSWLIDEKLSYTAFQEENFPPEKSQILLT